MSLLGIDIQMYPTPSASSTIAFTRPRFSVIISSRASPYFNLLHSRSERSLISSSMASRPRFLRIDLLPSFASFVKLHLKPYWK